MMIKVIFLLSWFIPFTAKADANTNAIEEAKVLYNQRKPALPQLKKAAALGDPESQFYLAEELSGPLELMTQEAAFWYEKSAAQGDMYAMYRLAFRNIDICQALQSCSAIGLSAQDWKNKLTRIAQSRSARGDSEAMSMLYLVTGDLDWLKKAANAGDASSQWLLASRYREGRGVFIIPSNRKKEEERLLKLAAENGFPKAQIEYAGILAERRDNVKGKKWYLEAVNKSFITALSSYAYMLEMGDLYDIPRNPQKAYEFHTIVLSLGTADILHETTAERLILLEKTLSPSEIAQAKSNADAWTKTHPPLSFYRIKLGW
ncbi:tetratricopeptide repeat protein [Pseudomonas sp. URMO17WK12:I11]|uniref:tetratricopeptide repeat protein n=1 Tax=Pseudomonas sp. URMO17WK12:I11 TaxID=1283291 RepID=UPI0018D8DD50|nr:tetratricopeptide repeat protein [Pseudomonas sp. URMO17WK12:I11]MBH3361501.1 sel1 repeat family protein [Pseudomonas sp. URMO17WK12:I11]